MAPINKPNLRDHIPTNECKSELAPNQAARSRRSARLILTLVCVASDGRDGKRTRVAVTELPSIVGPALVADREKLFPRIGLLSCSQDVVAGGDVYWSHDFFFYSFKTIPKPTRQVKYYSAVYKEILFFKIKRQAINY